MMMLLHPTYTIKVEIRDAYKTADGGSLQGGQMWVAGGGQALQQVGGYTGHKFWGGYTGKSGCDEALAAIRDALSKAGVDASVSLERFEHKA